MRMIEGLTVPEQLQANLKEVLNFGFANQASMDAEANAYFDKVLNGMATMYEQALAKVADSPEKRRTLRLIAQTKRKHHHAEGFLKGLGCPLPVPFPVAEDAKPIFLDTLQSVLDLLFDATRVSLKGPAQFGTIGMLYWMVDELNEAFYLTKRK